MRLLLKLDSVGNRIKPDQRQQITPDMRFTCDGMITKWIIGADWGSGPMETLYPELQLWRSNGSNVYQKINTILIRNSTRSPNRIYEYNTPPIPFQAGDILGVFIPKDGDSRIKLIAESGSSPTNYYITQTQGVMVSSYSSINILNTPLVTSANYRPLVTVEIGKKRAPTMVIVINTVYSCHQFY